MTNSIFKGVKMCRLEEFKDLHGWSETATLLGLPGSTLSLRLNSGKDWRVARIGKSTYRCAVIDSEN